MDVERLKNGGTLTDEFFERQLDKICEIRLSERKFESYECGSLKVRKLRVRKLEEV